MSTDCSSSGPIIRPIRNTQGLGCARLCPRTLSGYTICQPHIPQMADKFWINQPAGYMFRDNLWLYRVLTKCIHTGCCPPVVLIRTVAVTLTLQHCHPTWWIYIELCWLPASFPFVLWKQHCLLVCDPERLTFSTAPALPAL